MPKISQDITVNLRKLLGWLQTGTPTDPGTPDSTEDILEAMVVAAAAAVPIEPLGAGDVTTAKLDDLAVTTGKLADEAVTGPKLAPGAYRSLDVYCAAVLAEGDLLHVVGYDATDGVFTVEKADADAAKPAQLIAFEANAGSAVSEARDIHLLTTLNTNSASAVGDPVYLDTTAGGWTLTAPTGATAIAQIVGRVAVKSATVGEILFDLARSEKAAIGTTQLQASAVTEVKVAPASLTGLVAKVAAAANVIGAIPVVHWIHVTAGANGDTDIVLTHATKVIFAIAHPTTSVASATLQVKNGTNAITNAMATPTANGVVVSGTIDPAREDIAAGGTLRVTGAGGASMPAADVFVLGLRFG